MLGELTAGRGRLRPTKTRITTADGRVFIQDGDRIDQVQIGIASSLVILNFLKGL